MIVNEDKMREHLGLMLRDAIFRANQLVPKVTGGEGSSRVGRDTTWPLMNGRTVQISLSVRVTERNDVATNGSTKEGVDLAQEGSVA